MEKLIKFNQEQLNMVRHLVALEKGTEMEFKLFVEYCETVGLNPIMRQIMFQKRESKYGPRWYPLTTRDGYLWKARTSNDFIGGPRAGVVREGDEFGFDNVTGLVNHQFGAKRGNILGAWAVMKHKRYEPASTFVEFKEYSDAGANNPVWRSNPTAMIQKVAEVFVMRRQFPVDGLYTVEEFGVNADIDGFGEDVDISTMLQTPLSHEVAEMNTHTQPTNEKIEVSTTLETNTTHTSLERSEEAAATASPTSVETKAEPIPTQEEAKVTLALEQKQEDKAVTESASGSTPVNQEIASAQQPVTPTSEADKPSNGDVEIPANAELYTINSRRNGFTTSKTKFVNFNLTRADGTKITALAKEEHPLQALEQIPDGQTVMLTTKMENGFCFIEFVFKAAAQVA
jgi:phage recombination protein Bet